MAEVTGQSEVPPPPRSLLAMLLAALGLAALSVAIVLPMILLAAAVVFVAGGGSQLSGLPQEQAGEVFALWLRSLEIVAAAGVTRLLINLKARVKRSAALWACLGWLLIAGPFLALSSVAHGGAKVAIGLWLATGSVLGMTWLALIIAQTLWRWSATSRLAGSGLFFTGYATLYCWGLIGSAAADVNWHAVANELERAQSRELAASNVSGSLPTGVGPTDAYVPPPTRAELCYRQLRGWECEDVWTRARNSFGEDHVQTAYIYVCLERELAPPRLCGTFFKKAEHLHVDSWRYTRRFKDSPTWDDVMCPLPTAEGAALSQAEIDNLDRARSGLTTRDNAILDLAYEKNLTDGQIGLIVGRSESRIRALRRKAELHLREELKECQ